MLKFLSQRSKKPQFYGNRLTDSQRIYKEELIAVESTSSGIFESSDNIPHDQSKAKEHTASYQKLQSTSQENKPKRKLMKVDTEETRPSIRGFRFCDMKVLSPIFSVLPCGKCGNFSLLLKEDNETEGMCINFAFAVQAVWMETFILHIKEARKEF